MFLLLVYVTKNNANLTLHINSLMPICARPVSHSPPWFYLIIKSQIDFIFYNDVAQHHRSGREWVRCDRMGGLSKYTFLESSDPEDNEKKLFVHYFEGNKFSHATF